MTCKNCNAEVHSNFCADCGLAVTLKRIDGAYILDEIKHVLNIERGILYTIKVLATRPGQSIRQYLSENRSRLVKPVIFLILTSLAYPLSSHLFPFEDGYTGYHGPQQSTTTAIFEWIRGHYDYANIIMGLFIAIWIRLFFKNHQFNIFEILVLLCYVMGIGMLIFSVFAVIQGMTRVNLMQAAGIAGFAYTSWAIGQFFGKDRIINYIKALLAYLLGMLTFALAAVLAGTLTDLIIN